MLQKALDNLDVQLEDELTRYRQQRYRQSGQTRVQDLDAPRNTEVRQAPIVPPLPSYVPGYAVPQPMDLDVWGTEAPNYPPQSNLSNFDARRVVREMRVAPQTSGSSYLVPIASPPAPNADYFASSEELLKSFSHPEAKSGDRKSTLLDTLLTPLGVGSMLLLLLSSISLGYVLMHPSSLGFLAALGRGSNERLATATSPNDNQSLSPNLASDEFIDVNLNTLSQLPRSDRPSTVVTVPHTATPKLSQPETPGSTQSSVVTDAPRLSAAITNLPLQTITLPSRPIIRQSEPAPVSPVRASAPARASAPVPASAPISLPPTQTAYVAPAPQPASKPVSTPAYAPPAPSTPIAQAPPPANRYYVVTEYTGDPSLSQARQAVGDAYVRNFDDGAKVQMAAFGDSASAEQMARQLQQQGVPAQVYQP